MTNMFHSLFFMTFYDLGLDKFQSYNKDSDKKLN
jgi:hypothetical protein